MAPNSRSRLHHARQEEQGQQEPAFRLSPLPYDYSGLEPVIDHETLHWHHDVHHRDYVDKLNEALRGVYVRGLTLEEILSRVSRFPPDVRGNGGGHWNHTFFWSVMTDQKEDHEITPEVLSAIEKSFTSLEDFKTRFIHAGVSHLGSGWVWLVKTAHGRLEITTTLNQDNPLMDVVDVRGTPLLVCDLWEHAYYLKYKAKREEFLRKFFTVVNWSRVHSLFIGDHHGAYHGGYH